MSKHLVDLTEGGRCEECDDEARCVVCGAEDGPLFYAQSGDHTHLVMLDGKLGKEAHGRLMCQQHYEEDAARVRGPERVPALSAQA